MQPLSQTTVEIQTLAHLVTASSLGCDTLLAVGQNANCNATIAEVVAELPQASIVHLACHGQQNLANPLDSGFELEDGALSVAKLMSLNLDRAFFAFLSTCQSASGDETLPDEAVHLAATMLFVGFRGVVGTMWNMNDHDGPEVAARLYKALLETCPMFPSVIPIALDAAVRKLREKGVHPKRWATYIHLGI